MLIAAKTNYVILSNMFLPHGSSINDYELANFCKMEH